MKKLRECLTGFLLSRRRNIMIMKNTVLLLFIINLHISATVMGQKVTLHIENASLNECLQEIEEQTDLGFLYNGRELREITGVSVDVENAEVQDVLEDLLEKEGYTFSINNSVILIKKQEHAEDQALAQNQQHILVEGRVTDTDGLPIPGVNVVCMELGIGGVTNMNGYYSINLPNSAELQIRYSSIGMKSETILVNNQTTINVVMETEVSDLDEVVVTGFFERKKDTYTGVTNTVKGEELLKFGTDNVLESLNQIDPSFRILENNQFGSDPNRMPEISFRGAASFENALDDSELNLLKTDPNMPTFVIDGFVVSLQDVVDLDMNRVESITILKDAVAAVVYGSYAANGVFVIKTKDPEIGRMRVSYSGNYKVNVPDLSTYDMLSGEELLQYQENLGLYGHDWEQRHQFGNYMQIKQWLYEGVDTDWKSQPVQNSFAQQHSLNLSGGDQTVRYGLGASYNDDKGVMKGSFRENFAINMNLNYHLNDKLNFTNMLSFNSNKANNSQYGSFNDYLSLPSYFPLYNEAGQMNEFWGSDGSWGNLTRPNPLMEAQAGNLSRSEYTNVVNNLALNWTIVDGLKLTSRLGYSVNKSKREDFLSPKSLTYFNSQVAIDDRGEYSIDNIKSENISFNLMLNYTYRYEGHVVTSTIGGTLTENRSISDGMVAQGFSNDRYFPSFAKGYEIGGIPRGSEATMRTAGFLGSVNYSYRNVWLMDFAFRADGSSAYGSEEKYAPFFSVGSGVNLSSTEFIKNITWINSLRLTGSYGETGSVSFSPYQARDMFSYYTDARYLGKIGVRLKALGNESLVWQTTKSKELNLQLSVFDGLFDVTTSVYDRRTVDMISPVTLPTSSGFTEMTTNLGEMSNRGVEFNFRSILYKNEHSNLVFTFSGGHNKNEIMSISDGLKSYNERLEDAAGSSENLGQEYKFTSRFIEGRSIDDLYAVRSLGIDPETGKELFLDKDGKPTWEWRSEDMVVVGNRAPKIEGSIGLNYSYKRFSASVSGMYRYGGVAYNNTLLSKVENSDKWMNVDRRALDLTWQKPGDVKPFKANADGSTTQASSRFVQDNNQFHLSSINLQYRVNDDFCKRLLMTSMNIGVSFDDIFYTSTIERERGTTYPFARSFSLRLSANF